MLIVHVDYNESAWNGNSVNNNYSHQRMTWIPADDAYTDILEDENGEEYEAYTWEGLAKDTYPSDDNNSFSKNSTPAAEFYSKNSDGEYYMDGAVENITQNEDGTISFHYQGIVSKPTFSPKAGVYSEAQTVTISCDTEGATIHYTTDGSIPTAESNIYDSPITIETNTTLKAIAFLESGEQSKVATANYIIRSGATTDVKTFKRVTSTDEIASGLRYIIACGTKGKAAGKLTTSKYLSSSSITLDDDIITITDDVEVFTLDESDEGKYSFMNTEGKYLDATDVKKLAFENNPSHSWILENNNNAVEMVHVSYGTMTYNVTSPRFTTYTSNASTNMIRANLYVEYEEEPAQPLEIIIGNNNYKLITSEDQLEGNVRYLIVSNADDQYVAYSGHASNKGEASIVYPMNDVISLTGTSDDVPVPVVLQKQNQKWLIVDTQKESYMGANKDNNYLILNQTASNDYYRWMISINTYGDATIQNCGKASYLKYNIKDDMFRVYASGQNAISLYKEEQEQQNHGITTTIDALHSQQKSSVIFDLQGRRVINPQKGIYIVNGKKVVIK